MKEDPGVGCGYGGFLRWLLRRPMAIYKDICEKHDDLTTKGSFAQRIGITSRRIVEWWNDAIDERNKSPQARRKGWQKLWGRSSKPVIRGVNDEFYEGPR